VFRHALLCGMHRLWCMCLSRRVDMARFFWNAGADAAQPASSRDTRADRGTCTTVRADMQCTASRCACLWKRRRVPVRGASEPVCKNLDLDLDLDLDLGAQRASRRATAGSCSRPRCASTTARSPRPSCSPTWSGAALRPARRPAAAAWAATASRRLPPTLTARVRWASCQGRASSEQWAE